MAEASLTKSYDSERVQLLYASGWQTNKDFSLLEAYLRKFVRARHLAALIEMARIRQVAGKEEESTEFIRAAEQAFDARDPDQYVDLWSAYRSGLGGGTQAFKDQRALELLTQLGELGNVTAQETLMTEYLHGLNGVPRDETMFFYWATAAAVLGSVAARTELDLHKRRKGAKARPNGLKAPNSSFKRTPGGTA